MKKETSNKILLGLITFIFLTSILSQIVLAADNVGDQLSNAQTREAGRAIGNVLISPFLGFAEGVLQAIFGSQWAIGTRVFFFILLWLIIGSIIPAVFTNLGSTDNKFLQWMISFVIAVISVIAIPPEMLDNLLLSYGAMGATLLTMIPFAIILVFSITTPNGLLARATWIFFSVYFIGLYLYKIISANGKAEIMYAVASILGFIMVIFLGIFRKIYNNMQASATEESGKKNVKKAGLGMRVLKAAGEELARD